MKKLSFFCAASAMLLMGACTSEDLLLEQNLSQDEISFRAAAPGMSRAAESYCANNLPPTFQVWACTDADSENPTTLFFKDQTVVKDQSSGKYIFKDGSRFWPNESGLDFFAYRGDEGSFRPRYDVNPYTIGDELTKPIFLNYHIKGNVPEQLDLMYAVTRGAKRENGAVNLNFRHALCQVVFRAQVSNELLEVKVHDISVGGPLHQTGTFTFPTDTDTSTNWLDESHSDDQETAPDENGLGTWEYFQQDLALRDIIEYQAVTNSSLMTSTTGLLSLTGSPEGHGTTGWEQVMTLMPQKQDAWAPVAGGKVEGVYLKVNCTIYNVPYAGNTTDRAVLHDGPAYIPLEIDWKQGIRYVYTLNFGNGHAGFTDLDDPEPTLYPIEVTVSADDFMPYEEPTVRDASYIVNYYDTDGSLIKKVGMPKSLENTTFNITEDVFENEEGFQVIGWKTSPDATDVEYAPGAEVTMDYNLDEINFHAVREFRGVEFKVNFYEWVEDESEEIGGRYVLSTKFPTEIIRKRAGTETTEYQLAEPLSRVPQNLPALYNQNFTLSGIGTTNYVKFNGWDTLDKVNSSTGASTHTYTISSPSKELNLYSSWKYAAGEYVDATVPERNTTKYDGFRYSYNHLPIEIHITRSSATCTIWDDPEDPRSHRTTYTCPIVGYCTTPVASGAKQWGYTADECEFTIGSTYTLNPGESKHLYARFGEKPAGMP